MNRTILLRGVLLENVNKSGLSAKELSARSGIPLSTVRDFLNGRTMMPSLETFLRLSICLGIGMEDWNVILREELCLGERENYDTEYAPPKMSLFTVGQWTELMHKINAIECKIDRLL